MKSQDCVTALMKAQIIELNEISLLRIWTLLSWKLFKRPGQHWSLSPCIIKWHKTTCLIHHSQRENYRPKRDRDRKTDRQRDRDTMNILSAGKTAGLSVFLKGTWLEVSWCLLWRHNLDNTPDRGNFVVLVKKMGSCFLITNEFSTQFKTSIVFQSVWYWLTSTKKRKKKKKPRKRCKEPSTPGKTKRETGY